MLNLKDELSQNELNILKTIYQAGPISRVKISRILKLTRATVTVITKKLMELDLILEVGKGISTEGRGRREVLLTINAESGYIFTIYISLTDYMIGILDLSGKVLEKTRHSFELGTPPYTLLDPISNIIENYISRNHVPKNKIFGIVMALPGIIDYRQGMVREYTLSGWQGFRIRYYLENKFDIKVLLENDVKTYTMGEFQFGIGKHVKNMICLWLGNGIGAGIITNGHMIRGISSSAGEVGFNEFVMGHNSAKSILTASQPKCWGDLLSITNLKNTVRMGIEEGWKTELATDSDISDLIHAIENGDPLGLYIFKLLSQYLGIISRNLIYTFNPEILLLSGPLLYKLPRLASEVQNQLNKSTLRSPLESVIIKTSMLGENGILAGGVSLMLEYLFDNTNNHYFH